MRERVEQERLLESAREGMTVPDPVSALAQGIDLLDKAGILAKVKNKLLNDPDAAAAKLTAVLTELGGTYQIVDDMLVRFASLSFEDAAAQRDALETLNLARGGRLTVRMMEARGHCHKIWYIYDRYLRGWFSRALRNRADEEELEDLFRMLGNADLTWVDMLAVVARRLQEVSDDLIGKVESGDVAGAQEVKRDVVKEFRGLQTRLGNGLVQLQGLRQDFSALTGGIDL